MNKKKMIILSLISLIILAYLIAVIVLYAFQRNLLYHPVENNYQGDELTVNIEKVKIKTEDNINLTAWFHEKDIKNYKTILYFHGNAGSLENRIHKINHFKDMNINFLLIAWRGFSGNEGKPSEEGLYKDAKSAVLWLKKKNLKEEDIILYGESLGTGVAVEVAQNKNYAGVILESPFTSMVDAGKSNYPIFPIRLLLKDKYESDKKIKNIISPILIMHGEADKIVPFWMGKKMYELANNPKFSYFSKYDDHMMDFNEDLLSSIRNFVKNLN